MAHGIDSYFASPIARHDFENVFSEPSPVDAYRVRQVAQAMHWQGAAWLMRETRENEAASEMLRLLEMRAEKAEIKNVHSIECEAFDPHLPPRSCDLVLMVDVYHELSYPEPVLRRIRAALKPGGRVALVEFRTEDPDVPIKPEHKMSKEQMLLEFEANGFRLAASYDELSWQHLMFFEVR